jgi:hypothetical protein
MKTARSVHDSPLWFLPDGDYNKPLSLHGEVPEPG